MNDFTQQDGCTAYCDNNTHGKLHILAPVMPGMMETDRLVHGELPL